MLPTMTKERAQNENTMNPTDIVEYLWHRSHLQGNLYGYDKHK